MSFSILLNGALLFLVFSYSTAADPPHVKICHTQHSTACTDLKTRVGTDLNVTCVEFNHIYECLVAVKENKIDIAELDAGVIYPAGKIMQMKPFMISSSGYAVILLNPNSDIKNLDSLKNKKTCHMDFGDGGWAVPISNLMKMGKIPRESCYDNVKNAADFFDEMCLPGSFTKAHNPFNGNRPSTCALCRSCNNSYPQDALNKTKECLSKADLAFLRIQDEDVKKLNGSLLCPNNTVMAVKDYKNCNWGITDVLAMVTSSQTSEDVKNIISKNSPKYTKTTDDYKKVMGERYLNSFEHFRNCDRPLKWCTINEAEMKKCHHFKLAFAANRATEKLECIKATDSIDCMKKILDKSTDFATFDGGYISDALDSGCEVEPRISEMHSLDDEASEASYFAVAVVHKSSKLSFKDLKGANTCHTGYGKTSGWKVPIGLLIDAKKIDGDDVIKSAGNYFNQSCVPGVLESRHNPNNDNPKSLCGLCPNNCAANTDNKYYGYTGAFRCLVETGADVAFVKHTTVSESTDNKGTADWEKNLVSSDYRLLCSDGTKETVDKWASCNLAKVPAHAIVFRKEEGQMLAKRMFFALTSLDVSDQKTQSLYFKSRGGKNLLFKESSIGVSYIEEPNKFITPQYKKILKVFGKKLRLCSSSATKIFSFTTFTLIIISIINILF
ncbi:serotransferrin-1-like [Argonauta hians]